MKDLENAIMSGEESLDLDMGTGLLPGKQRSVLEVAVKRTVGKLISWISPEETAGFVLFDTVVPDQPAMNSDDAASVTTTDTLANDTFYDPLMEGEAGVDQTVPAHARRSVVADQLFQQNTNFALANILLALAPPFLSTLRLDAELSAADFVVAGAIMLHLLTSRDLGLPLKLTQAQEERRLAVLEERHHMVEDVGLVEGYVMRTLGEASLKAVNERLYLLTSILFDAYS
eukprot:Protomagalhaensia_wolfi_Nauph_80__1101@NODE_1643_length_1424_cov_302_825993_g1272_i0_p1_GENE_NODE_1643_length_1424_cov_302_825993_g1272_i0NODE_1643_length_1424_cov_302_825993_g1272_i0_p1_ORF_typecomplete_len250_score58_92_NODE_1643_length_1424_cov_302_825993_g1272_i063752